MIVLFMLGLTCLAIAGMKYVEGISLSLIVYAVVGVVCVVAYLVNLVRKKMEKYSITEQYRGIWFSDVAVFCGYRE